MHIAQVETMDRNFQRKTRSAHNKKNHAFFFHGNNNYNEEASLTYPLQSICLDREEKTQEQDKQSRTKEAKDLKPLEKAKIGTAVHQRAGCKTGARIRWRGEMCTLQTHEKTSHNSFFLSRRNWTRELRQARCRKILDRKGEEESFARKVASIHCEFFSSKQTPDYNLSQKNFPALQDNTLLTLSVPEFCSRRHKLVLAQTRKLIVEETEGIWRKKWFFLRSGS